MPLPKDKITAEEFFEKVPEMNELCELIEGQIVMQAAPSTLHQRIVGGLYYEIRSFIKSKSGKCEPFIAPTDVVLNDENVVQPDVFIVCDPKNIDDKRVNGAPDLIIEVLSNNRKDDLVTKHALYLENGVREYWIVDPVNMKTLVYFYDKSDFPNIYNFDQPIPVGIYGGELTIMIDKVF